MYNRPDSPYYDGDDPDADGKEWGAGNRLPPDRRRACLGRRHDYRRRKRQSDGVSGKKGQKGGLRFDFRLWNQDRRETYYDAADGSRQIYQRETDAEDDNWSLQAAGEYRLGNHHLEAGGETKRYGWGGQDVTYIDTSYFNGSINFFQFVSQGVEGQPDIMPCIFRMPTHC